MYIIMSKLHEVDRKIKVPEIEQYTYVVFIMLGVKVMNIKNINIK